VSLPTKVAARFFTTTTTTKKHQPHTLGNTRITFADLDNSGTVTTAEILQQNHYYPFGANIEGLTKTSPNKYQYNGKEWNADFGLEWNDYGARFYDPWVGRWWGVDLLAEKYGNWSSYHYVLGNPMKFVDKTGMSATSTHIDETGKVLAVYNDGDLGVYVHDKESIQQWGKDGQVYLENGGEGSQLAGYTDTWDQYDIGQNTFLGFHKMSELGGAEIRPQAPTYNPLTNSNFDLSNTGDGAGYIGMIGDFLENGKYSTSTWGVTGAGITKVFSSGWKGNQYMSTESIAKTGKTIGKSMFFVGAFVDIYQYTQGNQSGAKTFVNIFVGTAAFAIGELPSAVIGGAYFAADKLGAVDYLLAKFE
jgi:RHS repeat-associated protein